MQVVRQARESKKISECTDVEITAVMMLAYDLIGLRKNNWPDETSDMVLLNNIKRFSGNMRVDEIKTAFEFGVSGKLNCDMKHYQSFDCVFLNSVLNEYKTYNRIHVNSKLIEPVEEKQLSAQDKLSSVKQGIIENFVLFKETGEIGQFTAWQFAELWKMGVIKFTDERISQMKKDCIEPFRELMAAEKKDLVDKFSIERIVKKIENPEDTQAFKAFCRKYALKQFFKDLVDTGQHINELLK